MSTDCDARWRPRRTRRSLASAGARIVVLAPVGLVGLAGVACSGQREGALAQSPGVPAVSVAGAGLVGQPVVSGAWARAAASSGGSGSSAVYLVLHNQSTADDVLTGAHTEVATAEVHRSSMDGGVMRMAPAGPVTVPARGSVTLEPGGLHVMLLGLKRDLMEGTTIPLTLELKQAGAVALDVPVRPATATSAGGAAGTAPAAGTAGMSGMTGR